MEEGHQAPFPQMREAKAKATPKGFEPLRAEPNGFLVHLLSHSDKVSGDDVDDADDHHMMMVLVLVCW